MHVLYRALQEMTAVLDLLDQTEAEAHQDLWVCQARKALV